ncbi:hypothetical protein Z957_06950 [Clostridium sp. K25]|uniref:restriction endonuclease subunit S n=1 Tax=Clostridium sp. K25 TaxID=1443109 RepID=UPI0004D5B213|nr:restriction endonuclease subunit S [Clostridium sp. K25]KEI08619.1 hypothetical protein Z957_06950 [Clostridium sp. K25]
MAKNKKTLDELLQEAIVKDAPYEVPGNWVWSKLGILSKLITGNTPSKKKSEYYGGNISFVKPNDLNQGRRLLKSSEYLSYEGAKSARIIPKGSTAVCCIGSIGKCAFLEIECATNQQINSIIPNKIDNLYMYYYVLSDCFKNELISNSSSTTIAIINKSKMEQLRIPIAPLKEQERIVQKIECLFDKLDKAKELIEEVREDFEKRKASILEKAFTGELTEKWREENSTVNQSNMNKNLPYNWKMSKLIDTCEIIMGQSPKSQSYNDEGKGVPLINGPVEFGNSHFSKTIKSKWTTEPTKICLKNDLLLCVRGSTLGRINIAGFDACIGRGVAAIRSKMYQKYINYKIHSIRNKIYSIGTGTTFPNISRKQIGELDIEFPPLEEQKEIVRILDKLLDEENKIEKLTNLENQIELTKKSILAKAFRGELGTNDPSEESAMELLKEVLQEKL